MIQTSNFAKHANHPDAISISAKAPVNYKGKEFKTLAPKWHFFKKYKEDGDSEYYTKCYQEEVLKRLNPKEIYDKLDGAILLCYEKPGEFCHRRLVADWLEKSLGIEVPEIN